ncbi:helix-turn-helix domain-containing protein [Psychromonas marina]|uniref:helix-turn-helix domain-containing protein n=1 Tax=Psychromonas marina TaxID=88364 RepID=UPI003D67A80D
MAKPLTSVDSLVYRSNILGADQRTTLSTRRLSGDIKKHTDKSFNQYLHKIRIRNAIQLLLYSDICITDIAFQVGYSDSNYFSSMFKDIMGITPSNYRNKEKLSE